MPAGERGDVGAESLDHRSRRAFALGCGDFPDDAKGAAGAVNGSGADVFLPRSDDRGAFRDHAFVEEPVSLVQFLDAFENGHGPDFMSAEDQSAGIDEAHILELGQGADHADGFGEALAQGGDAQGDGAADAARGTDHPKSDFFLGRFHPTKLRK